jgi:hypothetical protein
MCHSHTINHLTTKKNKASTQVIKEEPQKHYAGAEGMAQVVRVPAWQVQGSEFKPRTAKKKLC